MGLMGLIGMLLVAQVSIAQDLDRGVKAHNRGDFSTALKDFELLAEQGDQYAQYNLGLMYNKGQGVLQDYTEAAKWYRKAAERGLAEAQTNLGIMYKKGQGVLQDYIEAVKWYRKAAVQKYGPAQDNLGLSYAHGQGVRLDMVLAYMWFNIATVNGVKGAAHNRDFAGLQLSSSEILEGQQLAKRCMKSGYKECAQ